MQSSRIRIWKSATRCYVAFIRNQRNENVQSRRRHESDITLPHSLSQELSPVESDHFQRLLQTAGHSSKTTSWMHTAKSAATFASFDFQSISDIGSWVVKGRKMNVSVQQTFLMRITTRQRAAMSVEPSRPTGEGVHNLLQRFIQQFTCSNSTTVRMLYSYEYSAPG